MRSDNSPVTMAIIAHTKKDTPQEEWEPLYGESGHAELTARMMDRFPRLFSPAVLADEKPLLRLLALAHDMGKASHKFQAYLKGGAQADHKTAAAAWAGRMPSLMGKLLPYVFHGHHSGLPAGTHLYGGVLGSYAMPPEVEQEMPPELKSLAGGLASPVFAHGARTPREAVFSAMLMVRMLHSALVDADWLATESYTEPELAAERAACRYDSMESLSAKVEQFIAHREEGAQGGINALRKRIHHACHAAGEKSPGLYRLNVPTGGGKTLSSLSFALNHARLHGMSRVIYVIPYTSIIDQTAREFRDVVGADNVLEHHSNLQPEKDTRRNRLAAENWDAPLIVTTSVQFFESLFSAQNRRCRKLHNIAHSVIIFDEAQNLPTDYLAPCLLAMKTLQRQYGCTLLLCTATQPALENRERLFEIGWPREEVHSLIGTEFEVELAEKMKRVEVEFLQGMDTPALLAHFAETGEQSALFIVNLTRQAQDLFAALREAGYSGLYHLSARMCPAHRTAVLQEVRTRLEQGLPTILVSTRVVEAGVDISFPVVYRDRCGLDSLAQSAGRCNRHGEAPMGRVFSYAAAEPEYALPATFKDLQEGAYSMEDTLAVMGQGNVFSPETVERYFQLFYSKRRSSTCDWDAMSRTLGDYVGTGSKNVPGWDFPAISAAFELIPGGQVSLLIPYGENAAEAVAEIRACHNAKRPLHRALRQRMQQLSVNIYSQEWGKLYPEHTEVLDADNGICLLVNEKLYHPDTGLLRESPGSLEYVL